MKYIVYLTTNQENGKIYIGVHKTEDPNIFDGYIGCGVNIHNSHTYKKSKTPFQYAVNKYGVKNFKRKTLKIFDTLEEAYELENELVNEDFIKRSDTYNVLIGGIPLPDTSKKVYQYDFNGNLVNEWNSIISAEKTLGNGNSTISFAIKNKLTSLNSLWTDFKVDILNIEDYNIYNPLKEVYQYDCYGKYENKYNSITHAAKEFNTTTSNIQRAIKGKYKVQSKYFSLDYLDIFEIPEKISIKNKNIHQYDLLGKYIRSFNNAGELCIDFGTGAKSGVLSSIRLGRAYKGFQWSIDKVDFMKELVPDKPKTRKVGKFNLNNDLLEEFSTITQCTDIYGKGVLKVLKGTQKTTKGFIFKYID